MATRCIVVLLAIAFVAVALPASYGSSDNNNAEPKNGTCVVMYDDGTLIDQSSRPCVDCQLQCYSIKCDVMIFDNVTVVREDELKYFRCDDEDLEVKWWDMCVELDNEDNISEGVERTCFDCMQGCESRGEDGCKTVFFGGVQVLREELNTFQCPPEPSPSPRPPSPAPLNCSEPAETGMCRASFQSYFYNETSGMCDMFLYGGCGGNTNRFDSEEECEAACKVDDEEVFMTKFDDEDDDDVKLKLEDKAMDAENSIKEAEGSSYKSGAKELDN